jgi:hypothetical protein
MHLVSQPQASPHKFQRRTLSFIPKSLKYASFFQRLAKHLFCILREIEATTLHLPHVTLFSSFFCGCLRQSEAHRQTFLLAANFSAATNHFTLSDGGKKLLFLLYFYVIWSALDFSCLFVVAIESSSIFLRKMVYSQDSLLFTFLNRAAAKRPRLKDSYSPQDSSSSFSKSSIAADAIAAT